MSQARKRSPVPLERDRRGYIIRVHGGGGWARGCGCETCSTAHRAAEKARDKSADQILTHGRGGYARGCQCEVCTAAHTEDMQARRPPGVQVPAEARRDEPVAVPMSLDDLTLVDRARGAMPRGRYMRMLVLEGAASDLGLDPDDLDEAKRPAARRENFSKRQAAGKTGAAKETGQ